MKGVTKLIREMGQGETVEVFGTARDNLYRIARKVGITVKVEKFVHGFYVTKTGDRLQGLPKLVAESGLPLTTLSAMTATERSDAERQTTINALRDVMQGKQIVQNEIVGQVDDWIYDKETYENGEILHWRHKPKCKPVIWKRESDLTGA